jgi:hypothetical protein
MFRTAAVSLVNRVSQAEIFRKKLFDELRRYGIVRTFRHQFRLLATRMVAAKPEQQKSAGSGGGSFRRRETPPLGLAAVKEAQAREASPAATKPALRVRKATRANTRDL